MPTSSESFYTLLGVSEKASKDDIKKAYRSLSLKHHPDRTAHAESHELFKKISEAYETLGDDQKRQEYDAVQRNPFMRMNSHYGRQDSQDMDIPMDEFFQSFFGGGSPFPGFPGFPGVPSFGETRGGPGGNVHFFFNPGPGMGGGAKFMQSLQKPTPIIKTIEITMEQVLNGANIPLIIERWMIENGNKTFENETLYVDIPKGVDENEIIILREKGNILNETIKGDVKLFIKINNATCFIRSGLDLLLQKTVSLKDALCGFTFELKYVNGKMYTLNCNSGNIIYPGYKKILPNMGLTRDGHTGNLIIEFQVDFPEMMTEKQIQALKEIL